MPAQTTAVQIALVRADHSNSAGPNLLTGSEKAGLAADGLAAYVGHANGYVLTFTNGLRVYLSGDTAIYGDMKTIIKDFYRVNLAVMNMGAFAMQGEEAAFAVDELIQPAAVIPSHVNEAATEGGVVRAGPRRSNSSSSSRIVEFMFPAAATRWSLVVMRSASTVANIVSRLTREWSRRASWIARPGS